MTEPFDLERFVAAQAASYDAALREVRAGRKTSHWMWYVFPQIAGLGASAMAQHYAIRSLSEARAYLDHPVLGARLAEISEALLSHARAAQADHIMGTVDALKLQSSMTLFDAASPGGGPFAAVLDAFYGGGRDAATLRLLGLA